MCAMTLHHQRSVSGLSEEVPLRRAGLADGIYWAYPILILDSRGMGGMLLPLYSQKGEGGQVAQEAVTAIWLGWVYRWVGLGVGMPYAAIQGDW